MSCLTVTVALLVLVVAGAQACREVTLTYNNLNDVDVTIEGTPSPSSKPTKMPVYGFSGSGSFWKPSNAVHDPFLYLTFNSHGELKIKEIRFQVRKAASASVEVEFVDGEISSEVHAISDVTDVVQKIQKNSIPRKISFTFVREPDSTSNIRFENLEVDLKDC